MSFHFEDNVEKKVVTEEVKKSFMDLLKREFSVNDLIEKYGNGGYSQSPNIPYEIQPLPTTSPDTHRYPYEYPNHQVPYQPYQTPTPVIPYERGINWDDEMRDALKRFEEEQRETEYRRAEAERYAHDKIQKHFKNNKQRKESEKKAAMKAAFMQLLSERINFDADGNMVDEDGNIIKSIGAFGLFFIRVLNSVLESKKTAEEHENDLKQILK